MNTTEFLSGIGKNVNLFVSTLINIIMAYVLAKFFGIDYIWMLSIIILIELAIAILIKII